MWHIEVLGGDDVARRGVRCGGDVARRGDDVAHRGVRCGDDVARRGDDVAERGVGCGDDVAQRGVERCWVWRRCGRERCGEVLGVETMWHGEVLGVEAMWHGEVWRGVGCGDDVAERGVERCWVWRRCGTERC